MEINPWRGDAMAATAPERKTQVRVLNRAITAFDVITAPTVSLDAPFTQLAPTTS
jgi:hypothetical protein